MTVGEAVAVLVAGSVGILVVLGVLLWLSATGVLPAWLALLIGLVLGACMGTFFSMMRKV